MTLCIRNQQAEKLAREVARLSEENLTQSVIHALEERLERLKGRQEVSNSFEQIMEISNRCRSLPDRALGSVDDILGYNEIGTFNGN